jgi:chorismate dehydratase
MLDHCDAALLIGDNALLLDHENFRPPRIGVGEPASSPQPPLEKIDLGDAWSTMTGLPFVWAFWAGRPDALAADQVGAIQAARDAGVADLDRVARQYFADPALQATGATYLRDNIKYHFGEQERAGLNTFYRYAAELGLVPDAAAISNAIWTGAGTGTGRVAVLRRGSRLDVRYRSD